MQHVNHSFVFFVLVLNKSFVSYEIACFIILGERSFDYSMSSNCSSGIKALTGGKYNLYEPIMQIAQMDSKKRIPVFTDLFYYELHFKYTLKNHELNILKQDCLIFENTLWQCYFIVRENGRHHMKGRRVVVADPFGMTPTFYIFFSP